MPIASSSSRMGRSSKQGVTTSCCARVDATPRSTACSCASRNRARRSPSHPWLEFPIFGRTNMSANAKSYVITPPAQAAIAVAGIDKMFPVRRIWCVGRNYEEHIREMGHDVRDPPFFFSKPADAIVPDGASVPYPPLTKDMHHEVELVVALKSGGRNIPLDKALDCIYGYGVGIDLTRRDLQPASKIGYPSKGRIALKVNGKLRQDGDLAQMIWNVPEVIGKLSEMVALAAGDIIMTGTPSGVAATVPGDKLECEIEGVGGLTVTIGPPAR